MWYLTIDCHVSLRPSQLAEDAEIRVVAIRLDVVAVPPASSQCLKERSRVGIAIGLCLHQIDEGLLVGLLRVEQGEIVDVAKLQSLTRNGEAAFRRTFGDEGLLQGDSIRPDRGQGIGNILKRDD